MMISRSEKTSHLVYEKADFKQVETNTPSKGTAEKYTNGSLWVKLDRFGYECLVEVIASRVVSALGFSTVEYRPCFFGINKYQVADACVSDNFVAGGYSSTSVGNLLMKAGGFTDVSALFRAMYKSNIVERRLGFVTDLLKGWLPEDVLLSGMAEYIWLDSTLLNTDRHVFNMVLLNNGNDWSFVNFDYGASLCSDLTRFPMEMPLQTGIWRSKAKPFSTRYSSQLKLFDEYLPKSVPSTITIDVSDLYDYYEKKHVDRCINILRKTLGLKGIELTLACSFYTLADLQRDPSTLKVVMEKHWNYAEWFNDKFHNGAPSKEAVLNKLNEED